MAEYVFTLRNVRKAHGDKVVLDNVTLSFLHGAKIGVVGPNGTGKSTLLKIMAGLEHPNNGEAILDPESTRTLPGSCPCWRVGASGCSCTGDCCTSTSPTTRRTTRCATRWPSSVSAWCGWSGSGIG